MKAREFNPLRLDVEAFATAAGSLSGTWSLGELPRLLTSGPAGEADAARAVAWSARGERIERRGGEPLWWLHLEVRASVALECQRCLGPVETPLEVERSFRFVRDESEAAELDAEGDDDVLALSRAFNLRELVEDELLLALPLVPRHEVCPEPLTVPVDDLPSAEDEPAERPQPFAVLAQLKKGRPD